MANKILPVADALKQLYTSLGGEDPAVLDMSTNTEIIQEIAKIAEGGGGGGSSDPYPEYDVIVKSNHSILGLTSENLELIKGDWTIISSLIANEKPIKCFVYYCSKEEDAVYYQYWPTTRVYADIGYHNAIEISVSESINQASSTDIVLTESGLRVGI